MVYVDFEDDNPASVSVLLNCSSGNVVANPQLASEASPAVFTIENASANANCIATENSLPSGYTAHEADCQDGDPLDGFCTIVNMAENPGTEEIIRQTGFETGDTDGWVTDGDVSIDGILAVGQYSLRHMKGASSTLNVSTVGYESVHVTMHLAGTSLKKNDTCLAEASIDGGSSWNKVVEIASGNDSGTFLAGQSSSASFDDNANVQMRFRSTGPGSKGGYCYGDDVVISGVPIGN
jgi:hypothetical protein